MPILKEKHMFVYVFRIGKGGVKTPKKCNKSTKNKKNDIGGFSIVTGFT